MPKRNLVFTFAAALFLAACQTVQVPVAPEVLAPTTTAAAVVPAKPLVFGAPGAEGQPRYQPLPQERVNADPTQVVGLAPPEVRSLLGQPEFVRRDSTAVVWQYRRDRCVLDLFLYDDGAGTDQRVVYYDVRPLRHDASSLGKNAQQRCFAQLLRSGNAA